MNTTALTSTNTATRLQAALELISSGRMRYLEMIAFAKKTLEYQPQRPELQDCISVQQICFEVRAACSEMSSGDSESKNKFSQYISSLSEEQVRWVDVLIAVGRDHERDPVAYFKSRQTVLTSLLVTQIASKHPSILRLYLEQAEQLIDAANQQQAQWHALWG